MQSVPITTNVVSSNTTQAKCSRYAKVGQWFSSGTLVCSTIKTDRHDITDILLKLTFSTITPTRYPINIQILANKIMVVCCVLLYWYSILSEYNHIGSVMVNVLASSVVNNGFGSWSGQTGDYKIGICAPLRRMSKEWYVRNHDNVSKWSDMSLRRLLFRWVSTIKIQLSVDLVQADITNIIISLKCNLFSARKSAHVALNNNFS
jgi:hypothetical protein